MLCRYFQVLYVYFKEIKTGEKTLDVGKGIIIAITWSNETMRGFLYHVEAKGDWLYHAVNAP